MHAKAVHGGQEPFSLCDKALPGFGFAGAQQDDEASHNGSDCAVTAFGLGSQHWFDSRSVAEGHPNAGVHSELFIQGKELTQEVQHRGVLPGAARSFAFNGKQSRLQPAADTVDDGGKGEHEKLVAAGKIVPHGAYGQSGFISYFTKGCPLQTVACDDPEDSLDNFLAPGFGINNFGHQYFLARTCFNTAQH